MEFFYGSHECSTGDARVSGVVRGGGDDGHDLVVRVAGGGVGNEA